MNNVTIRRYTPDDAEDIARLYESSVREIAIAEYSPDEVDAWASYADEVEELRYRLAEGLTLVAETEGRLVAFGQLKPLDHIAFLYTVKEFSRMGIATSIYEQLEQFAIGKGSAALGTDASRVSKPLFEKLGFRVVKPVVEERKGIKIECFVMKKDISETPPPRRA